MSETPKGKSTAAMQKLRANPEYKLKEERKRLIQRIKSGTIPRATTLQKYNITMEDVNKIRNDTGLKKIKEESFSEIIYKPMNIVQQEINTATTEQIEQIQKQAAIKITSNQDKLQTLQEEAKTKYKNFIVNVDKKDLFNVTTVNKWFWKNPGVSNVQKGQPRKPSNLTKMFGNEGKPGGYIMRLFNDLLDSKNDISKALNIKTIKEKYKSHISPTTKKAYHNESIQGHMSALSIIMREYPAFDIKKEHKQIYDELQDYINSLSSKNQANKLQNQANEIIMPYKDIKKMVLDNPKINSKMKLYMELYEDFPTRDNLGNLLIVKRKITPKDIDNIKELNNGDNLIFIDKDEITLAFINYKTVSTFGYEYHNFIGKYKELILKYLENNKSLTHLFGKAKKLSSNVRKMLITAGVKKKDDHRSIGSINLLRKAFVSQELQNVTKPEERENIAKMLKHMPATSLKYNRKQYISAYEKNIDTLEKVKYDENI